MGSRLGKRYAAEIQAAKKAYQEKIVSAAKIEQAHQALSELLIQAQVDKKMCDIINGEFRNPRIIFDPAKKELVLKMVPPNAREVLAAIAEYNHRFGSYSPDHVIHDVNEMPTVINWNPDEE